MKKPSSNSEAYESLVINLRNQKKGPEIKTDGVLFYLENRMIEVERKLFTPGQMRLISVSSWSHNRHWLIKDFIFHMFNLGYLSINLCKKQNGEPYMTIS